MGFGNSPLGPMTPMGTSTPVEAPELLGETEAARFIDPLTKDFSSSQGTGRLDAMPKLRQRIVLALTTTLQSSSAMPGLGMDLSSIQKIDKQFQSRVIAKVKLALNQMANIEKAMRIESIIVTPGANGRASILVNYTDLSNNTQDKAVV